MNDTDVGRCRVCGAPTMKTVEIISMVPPYEVSYMDVCDAHVSTIVDAAKALGGVESPER